MPLLKFEPVEGAGAKTTVSAIRQFIRFLTAHEAHPELVREILRPVDAQASSHSLYALIRNLKPREMFAEPGVSPFDALQKTLELFNGSVVDASEIASQDTPGRQTLDQFLEEIPLEPRRDVPDTSDILLMIGNNRRIMEQTLDMALAFTPGTMDSTRVMAVRSTPTEETTFLLRVRNLVSTYPLHFWQTQTDIRIYYHAGAERPWFIEWGFRCPFPEMATLHSFFTRDDHRTGMAILSDEAGHPHWRYLANTDGFLPVSHVADIHFSGRLAPEQLIADEKIMAARPFQTPLSLRRALSRTSESSTVGAALSLDQIRERIRTLEIHRARLDRELAGLRDREQIHYLCLFEDRNVDAIERFLTEYPISRLRRFLYLRGRLEDAGAPCHLLISKEGAGRDDIPGEIAQQGALFIRDASWHALGVDAYLPEYYSIRPSVGFDQEAHLLRAFEATATPEGLSGKGFIVRPGADETEIEKIVIPLDQAIELTDAIRYINANMRAHRFQIMAETSLDVQIRQFERVFGASVDALEKNRDRLLEQFAAYLDELDRDMDEAIAELDERRREMDDYVAARRVMVEYCRAVRELVQHPGNQLVAFIRRETELNRSLVAYLSSIDYRYTLLFETYELQARQLINRNHDELSRKLEELLQKIEGRRMALENQTQEVQNAVEGYGELAGSIRDHAGRLSRLHGPLKERLALIWRALRGG